MYNLFSIIMILGFIGCYMPQIVRTYRTKSVADISIGMWWVAGIAYLAAIGTMWYTFLWAQFITYILGLGCTILEIVLYYKYLPNLKQENYVKVINIYKPTTPPNLHIF